MPKVPATLAWLAGALLAASLTGGCASAPETPAPPAPAAETPEPEPPATQTAAAEAAAAAAAPEAPPAPEPPARPWDQEEMTRLSGELVRALRDLRRAWRREPMFADPNNPNRRAAMEFDQTLRRLDQRATQLHNRVRGGGGFEETRNIARNIGSLLNDADVNGRRIMPTFSMDERIRPAVKLINEIAPFYGRGPLFDPETLQRLDRPQRNR